MHPDSQDRRPLIFIFAFAILLLGSSYWIQFFITSETLRTEKIAQLVRLFSIVLLFTGAVLYFTERSPFERIRRNSFPLTIGGAATMLLVGYRFLIGSGIGLHPVNATEIASGFLYYPEDNFEYVVWAIQAEKGAFLFRNLYTLDDHQALYFNPFFVFVGITARILMVSPIPLLIVIGILSGFVLILIVFQICREMNLPERAGRWATLLAAFSSGISVIAYYAGKWMGVAIPVGSDLRYLDSILFSTFYALPYHSFAFMMQGIVVWLVYRCERETSTVRDFCMLAVIQAFSAMTRPYEWVLLIFGYSLYLALSRQLKDRKRLAILLLLGAVTAPPVLYNWWVSHQPVWETFARSSLNQEKFRLYWLLGYGMAIPLTILGTFVAWKNSAFEKTRWIASTACLAILLLVVFNIREAKVAACSHLYLCLTSGIGIHSILTFVERIRSVLIRNLVRFALIPSLALVFGTSLFLMVAYFHTDKLDSEIFSVAKAIRPGSAVLCSNEDGSVLPGISGAHVYSGQWALTPRYSDKKRILTEAGFEQDTVASGESFNRLIASDHFDFVVVSKERPAYDFIRSWNRARLIECYPRRCLFEIVPTNR